MFVDLTNVFCTPATRQLLSRVLGTQQSQKQSQPSHLPRLPSPSAACVLGAFAVWVSATWFCFCAVKGLWLRCWWEAPPSQGCAISAGQCPPRPWPCCHSQLTPPLGAGEPETLPPFLGPLSPTSPPQVPAQLRCLYRQSPGPPPPRPWFDLTQPSVPLSASV